MSRSRNLAAILALLVAQPALAQMDMSGMAMPGMKMPAKPAPKPRAAAKPPAHPASAPHHAHAAQPDPAMSAPTAPPAGGDGMDMHGAMDMPHAMPMQTPAAASGDTAPAGTDQPAGHAAAPAPPADHAADAVYGAAAMADARTMMAHEHGGMAMHRILFNLAEVQLRKGRDAYRWDAEGWYGGDLNRLVVKSEGDGRFGGRTDEAEVQALYSRAIGPYFDVQGGVRQDIGAGPKRTYATAGIEGLAPYWFDVEARLFLSDKGDWLGRIEGWHDMRLTQRLILQPRAELNFAAQDVPESGIGGGLTDAELGLRLRYEIRREFAPYAGVSWVRRTGATARYARAADEPVSSTALVLGTRLWF